VTNLEPVTFTELEEPEFAGRYVCDRCSAVVCFQTNHIEWHNRLTEAMQALAHSVVLLIEQFPGLAELLPEEL
jgi:hypothetical protein